MAHEAARRRQGRSRRRSATRSVRWAAARRASSARTRRSRSTTRTPRLLKYFITDRGKLVPRRLTGQLRQAPARDRHGGQPGADDRAHAVRRDGNLARAMRVILRDDLDNLGNAGEVVTVRDGLRRATTCCRAASPSRPPRSDVARVEHEKRVIAARTAKLAKELQAEARQAVAGVGLDRARRRRGRQALRLGHHPRHRRGAAASRA